VPCAPRPRPLDLFITGPKGPLRVLSPLAEWWASLTTGRTTCRLVALRDGQIVAALAIQIATRRGDHTLTLHVHPDYRGQVEEMLVTEALSRLWPYRERATVVTLPVGHVEIVDALKRYGFVERRTLTLMQRSLREFDE